MKSRAAAATRFLQEGLLIYSSGTLHHQRNSVRGFLFKETAGQSWFQVSKYNKRYLIVDSRQSFIQLQEQPVTKQYKQIFKKDIICLQNTNAQMKDSSSLPWIYSFDLKTVERNYTLYAPTKEERDLWVNGISRILRVPVTDPEFVPMGAVSKAQINLHHQVMQTEGNNVQEEFNGRKSQANAADQLELKKTEQSPKNREQ